MILAVMILGMIYAPQNGTEAGTVLLEAEDSVQLWGTFVSSLPTYMKEISLSLLPIFLFFMVFQLIALHLSKRLAYTYVGLVLFLTGANVGFMPAGNYLGQVLASRSHPEVLIPIAIVIGYFIVKAEPAVYVLNKQVEEITDGAISARSVHQRLSVLRGLHGAGADRDLHPLVLSPWVWDRTVHLFLRTPDLYSHRLRLRRRGLRPYDRRVLAPLSPGGLHGPWREPGHRCLRRGGHGGHDPSDHHPGDGPGYTAQGGVQKAERVGRDACYGL